MRAVAVIEKGKLEVVDVPKPEIREYECLVKVKACGFCNSTDIKTIDNEIGNGHIPFPIILGHESAGEVIEKGSKVKNIELGDRFLNPYYCPPEPYNRYWGGMVEYAIVQDFEAMDELGIDKKEYKARAAARFPNGIPFEDAGVILTLREIYSGVNNFGIKEGMEVFVFGDGPVGMGLAHFCKLAGAKWVGCAGHRKHRIDRINKVVKPNVAINSNENSFSEALNSRKLDLIIDAVGSTDIIMEASNHLKSGGKVGAYGVIKEKYSSLKLTQLNNNTCVHMLNYPHGADKVNEEICNMIISNKVDPKAYYSHVMPMGDIEKAVEMTRSREAFKVILKND